MQQSNNQVKHTAMEHNAGINVSSQFLEACGITASPEPSSVWQTDKTSADAHERLASVYSLLQNYITGFSSTDDILVFIPEPASTQSS